MKDVYFGLGSNLGNKEENLLQAIDMLSKKCQLQAVSSAYETEPVGYEDQDWFVNCAVYAKTDLSPQELLDFIETIHKKLKRKRTIKWGPRTIDIDILFYGNETIKTAELEIPHSRLHERQFVLMPLAEIAPDLVHPVLKKTITDLQKELPMDKAVKRKESSCENCSCGGCS